MGGECSRCTFHVQGEAELVVGAGAGLRVLELPGERAGAHLADGGEFGFDLFDALIDLCEAFVCHLRVNNKRRWMQ